MAASNHWTKTVIPLAAVTAAGAIPLAMFHPIAGAAAVYISVLAGVVVHATVNTRAEKAELRKAAARAEGMRTVYMCDRERFRAALADIDARAAHERGEAVKRLEAEYAGSRATEHVEWYEQGVHDGEAGVWRQLADLPAGNLVSLDERRHPPAPRTGSTHT